MKLKAFYINRQETGHSPKQDMLITAGDQDTKVGNKVESNVIIQFGIGVRNGGDCLVGSVKPTTCPLQTRASNH